jgi:hypothetical protein
MKEVEDHGLSTDSTLLGIWLKLFFYSAFRWGAYEVMPLVAEDAEVKDLILKGVKRPSSVSCTSCGYEPSLPFISTGSWLLSRLEGKGAGRNDIACIHEMLLPDIAAT